MELTGARSWRPNCRVMLSRGASIPSGVEPARRRFVKAFSYADCFFRHPLASSTYAELPDLRHSRRGLPSSGNRPMMTDHESAVQSNDAVARPTSGSNLTPGSLNLRKVRRAAAGFNAGLQRPGTQPVSHFPARIYRHGVAVRRSRFMGWAGWHRRWICFLLTNWTRPNHGAVDSGTTQQLLAGGIVRLGRFKKQWWRYCSQKPSRFLIPASR